MKTLVLVRHAKSDWGDPSLADHDRPLNERGRRDAPRMGRRLAERGTRPDVILSSTAVRARSTAEAFAAELGIDAASIVLDGRLYGSSPSTMLAVVGEVPDDVGCVMLVAHDPGMSELAEWLSADSGSPIDRMPTSAVAEFEFDVDTWSGLRLARPVRVQFDRP